MCGIAGFIADPAQRQSSEQLDKIARAMDMSIAHRGPDDHDVWIDRDAGAALVHRRLSIVDLSAAGHQPMHSADGRYVLVFNGEIYNHFDLRTQLVSAGAAPAWRGHSDTETMLASINA